MARTIPDDRLERLAECAAHVFIAQGYQRTQMADVAAALGVAKGTLYLYVESKEALFDLVARWAAGDRACLAAGLPIPTPAPGTTLRFAAEELAKRRALPELTAALAQGTSASPRAELEAVVRELYRTVAVNRLAIKLLDRSSADYPELAALWFEEGRAAMLAALGAYLERRIADGSFRRVPDVAIASRLMLETIVLWAVHRHWDPHPQPMDDTVAEQTVVQFVTAGLVKE